MAILWFSEMETMTNKKKKKKKDIDSWMTDQLKNENKTKP